MKGFFPILVVGVICMFQMDSIMGEDVNCHVCADAKACETIADAAGSPCVGGLPCTATYTKEDAVQSRGCAATAEVTDGCGTPDTAGLIVCNCKEALCNKNTKTSEYAGAGGGGGNITNPEPATETTTGAAPGPETATATGLIGSIPLLVLGMAGVHLKFDL